MDQPWWEQDGTWMRNERVCWRDRGGIALLTLSNPPANGYSYEMMQDLDEAILAARMRKDIHVIVLAGQGERFFCAGADIGMLHRATPEFKYMFCLHANETLLRLEHTPKLVIAALGGHCVGGGLEVALACDFRWAWAGSGKCGLPEVALGVLPGTGGTQRLARVLGAAAAMEWMASGRTVPHADAAEVGLVNKVMLAPNHSEFLAEVMHLASRYCPPHSASMAIGHIKRAVQTGSALPLESGLALERELQARLFASEDAATGIGAFVDKEKASFKGR